MNDPIPLPKDPRHQRFADLVLSGVAAPAAYRQAGFSVTTPGAAKSNASRVLKRADVQQYMTALRQQSARGKVLEIQEKREFLARVVRTPLMSINPHHPEHKDGDLILKYKRTETETGGTEEIVKLDPLKAIAEDNRLSGDDPEANALGAIAEALGALGNVGALPVDKM